MPLSDYISAAWFGHIAPLLYRVSPADPVSIAGAALFLIVVAVLASLIPALRATRVDPMVALRQE
jgi:ABC-type antimicrobial peptide transport system permease subunit